MRSGAGIYHRADGRWEARYKKGRNAKGALIYGFVYGDTQEEAEQKRAEVIKELSENNPEYSFTLPVIKSPKLEKKEDDSNKKYKRTIRVEKAFSDSDAFIIEKYLIASESEEAIGIYLSLNVGLSLQEIMALQYKDINLEGGTITITEAMDLKRSGSEIKPAEQRTVVIPTKVRLYLRHRGIENRNPKFYVMTNAETPIYSYQTISAKFRRIMADQMVVSANSVNALRSTFIRRCLESNMNIESVSLITGMSNQYLYRYFGDYIKPDVNAIHRLDTGVGYIRNSSRHLNLLIVGAGSLGQIVKEIAEKLGVFGDIKFLDDRVKNENVIGIFSEYGNFINDFPCAFVALGDNEKRKHCVEKLRSIGYMLPHIIHPAAMVSKDAKIGDGTIILSQATVNAGEIGTACIIASNALVSPDSVLGDYIHVDCGGMVLKGANVPDLTMIESGKIFE